MCRVWLLVVLGATVCVAQERGFINRRLLKADFLRKPAIVNAPKPKLIEPDKGPCLGIAPQERIKPSWKVDPKIIVPFSHPSPDPKMIVPPPPECADERK